MKQYNNPLLWGLHLESCIFFCTLKLSTWNYFVMYFMITCNSFIHPSLPRKHQSYVMRKLRQSVINQAAMLLGKRPSLKQMFTSCSVPLFVMQMNTTLFTVSHIFRLQADSGIPWLLSLPAVGGYSYSAPEVHIHIPTSFEHRRSKRRHSGFCCQS